MHIVKKFIRGILYVCYVALIVYAALYFVFWTSYRDELLQKEPIENARERLEPRRHIDPDTMRLLGSVHQTKDSSFVNFERDKAPGTIRVCALGDSNTQGDEVGVRHDYPSYLQRFFQQRGFDRVEVLNFGNAWFGFSQIYVIWKNVAKTFDCDYTLLLPMDFWVGRDVTFNHTRGQFPDYLHARLVLDDDELRLIAPIGATAQERLEQYVRPIPHWRYLRYDRHPPNILNSPLSSGRSVPNPLYYDLRPGSEEMLTIYAMIIRAIAEDVTQVAVVFRGEQRDLYPKIIGPDGSGIGVALLDESRTFPYIAPAGHPSAWGQEMTALAFFELLTGGDGTGFKLASAEDITTPSERTPQALHRYKRVWLEFDGERLGYFVPQGNSSQFNHAAHVRLFRRQKIAGVLSLSGSNGSVADACLLPLRNLPASNAELVFEADGDVRTHLSLGNIRPLHGELAIYAITVASGFPLPCTPPKTKQASAGGSLTLEGVAIAGIRDGRFTPEHGPMLRVRDSGEYLASIESLTEPGVVRVALENGDGSVLRRPLFVISARQATDFLQIEHRIGDVITAGPD